MAQRAAEVTSIAKGADGGEAILDALRRLGVDYIISSPGSEWPPVWEALARQNAAGAPGPKYLNCWDENLAVAMALGYTCVTGRMQAVLLHAEPGILQAALAIQAATYGEIPVMIATGGSNTFGENPTLEPGPQWYRSLNVMGGPSRVALPLVKWSGRVPSHHALYESMIRIGELAQRVPRGPTYLDCPLEMMLEPWTPPQKRGPIPLPPPMHPQLSAIDEVAALVCASKAPFITTDVAGKTPEGFNALVELADLIGAPVIEPTSAYYASFPKDHPLHLGSSVKPFHADADLALVVANRTPWYPPSNVPPKAKVIVVDENPLKTQMQYQTLQADRYLEGDVPLTLKLLCDAIRKRGVDAKAVAERRARWGAEHDKQQAQYKANYEASKSKKVIDIQFMSGVMNEVMPKDVVYVEETVTHRITLLQLLNWSRPQSWFHGAAGIGVTLGMAVGIKLAMPERPVVALMGDGSFFYNRPLATLGAAHEHRLPMLTIVFNNRSYAAMKQAHLLCYPQGIARSRQDYYGIDIPGPDYSRVAAVYDGFGARVEQPEDLRPALEQGLAEVAKGRLAVVDVVLEE